MATAGTSRGTFLAQRSISPGGRSAGQLPTDSGGDGVVIGERGPRGALELLGNFPVEGFEGHVAMALHQDAVDGPRLPPTRTCECVSS